MRHLKRKLEKTIAEALKNFPIVSLIGARQVGKSTLLKKIAPKAKFYDLERTIDFERINSDPELFLSTCNELTVIDEAQLSPNLFNALRIKVDCNRKTNGQFLISGSSSHLLVNNISESLAGRVAIIEVPTLTWDEALEKPASKIYDNLREPQKFEKQKALYSYEEILDLCLYGLYPEAFLKRKQDQAYDLWQDSYFQTYINSDIRSLFPSLQLETYRRFIKMLINSSGDLINASNFARSLDVSQPSIKKYLEIAENTFLWRRLNPYTKNSKKRLVKTPRGYIKDPCFINYVNKFSSSEELISHPNFGYYWEAFVSEQIIKNLESRLIKAHYYFFRTHDQAEVDLIIQSKQGLIPIEIKSGRVTKKEKLKSLENFILENNCPYGIIVNQGEEIFKLTPNIYQVPAKFL
jgi:uncharacterized protein